MNEWHKNYDYKINIGAGVYMMVIGLSIIITLVTVSLQAIRAATANPTKSLRTERRCSHLVLIIYRLLTIGRIKLIFHL
jgi:hypothetical protein